ncbi:MAG: cytochrome c peroxidase, partial [Planctomycetota bacterium]|nr:cytochrome c peroxidase [Planctomycetota bacterium]
MRKITTLSVLLIALVALVFATAEAGGKDRHAKARTPKEEALVALGRRLFFDPVVSRSAARSCASCHDPEHGFADPLRVSDDDIGRTRRHSQTLIDSHRNPTAHWDGEFETIEELVLARIGAIKGRRGKLGHGTTLLDAVAQEVGGEDIEELFGDPETDVGDEEVDDDVIDDGDDPDGGNDDENPYGGDGDVRREPSTAAPKSGAKSPGASRPTTPTTPSAPRTPSAKAPAGAAPEAPAPKADAPKADAPEAGAPGAKPDVKEPKAKAAPAAKADEAKPTAAELKRRADALRESLRTLPVAHDVLELGARYDEALAAAFGNRKVNAQRIARAIAAYCRSLESTTAPYDRYMAGDADALSASAKRGLALFRGRAGCAQCHTMDGEHPAFTDFDFHNTGVVWNRLTSKQRALVARHDETFRRKRDDLEMPKGPDEGRARVSTRRDDLRAFKTPTLRDVSRRGPYMHDGRFKTLTDVVSYYARGASPDPAKTSHVKAFEAGARDIDDLVAFLESLTGDTRPGLPTAAWRERAAKTRLQFVDADGKPLVGLTVALRPVGDR